MSIFGGPPPGASSRDPAQPSSVRASLRTLLSFAETRARLAANELEEQVLRLAEVAVWAAAAMLFAVIGLVFLSLFVVLLFWDSNRLLAAGLVAAFFVIGGIASALMARAGLAARPKFLTATLAELKKDREKLGAR